MSDWNCCDCDTCLEDCECECHIESTKQFLAQSQQSDTMTRVAKYLDDVESMLARKNVKYKDSCYHPKRIFSKESPIEQLKVRIDDKLSRITDLGDDPFMDLFRVMLRVIDGHVDDEDTVMDLIGYLVLLACAPKEER